MNEKIYHLKKYSLGILHYVSPQPFEGILQNTGGSITEGVFLTTNEFNCPREASDYLAITYTPKYENVFELSESEKADQVEFINPNYYINYQADKKECPSRVWPAFGHHGGACEIVLIKGLLTCKVTNDKFPDGGEFDEYRLDSTKADMIFANKLFNLCREWLVSKQKRFSIKVMDGLGIVLSWLGEDSECYYSISCAYKEDQGATRLKFWGYVWHDDEQNFIRRLSCPVEKEHPWDTSFQDLKNTIASNQAIRDELTGIKKQLNNIATRNMLDIHLRLPPYVSLVKS